MTRLPANRSEPRRADLPMPHLASPGEPLPQDARPSRLQNGEFIAWAGFAGLALVLRLAGLGTLPLSDAEASQALASWQLYQGLPVGYDGPSPLLTTFNLVGFAIFGGSDFVARLAPALLGVALVLLPMTLRRQLGGAGALVAAALFALSPITLNLSRTANGDIGALVGGLAMVVGLFRWLDSVALPAPDERTDHAHGQSWWLVVSASGLALMIISSPSAYSILALSVVFWAAAVLTKSRRAREMSGITPALRMQWSAHRTAWVSVILAAGAIATGLFFNPAGLAATVGLSTEWIRGFVAPEAFTYLEPRAVTPSYPGIILLGLYEPLALLAGIFGLSIALVRRRLFDLFLVWWCLGGLLLDLMRPGRGAGEVLLPLVPTVLLAGLAIGRLLESVRREATWAREGMIVLMGLIICAYGYVELMVYTRTPGGVVWLPVAAIGMFIVLVLVFWQWHDGASALRGAALTIVIAMLLFGVATAARLDYGRFADASQPMLRAPAGEGVRDLLDTLQIVSIEKTRDPYLVDIVADRALGPAVEWQLRLFPNLTWVESVQQLVLDPGQPNQGGAAPSVIISTEDDLPTEQQYAGQGFVIRTGWRPAQMDRQSLVRWLVLRSAPPTASDLAVLWVRQESADGVGQ